MFVNWCHILLVLQSHISNVMCKERGLADALLINEESSKSVSTPPEVRKQRVACYLFKHICRPEKKVRTVMIMEAKAFIPPIRRDMPWMMNTLLMDDT